MKILLKADVKKVGQKGDVVNVSDGFALNLLLPRELAREISDKEIEMLEKKMENEKDNTKKGIKELHNIIDSLEDIELALQSNEKGTLFSSVSEEVLRKELKLPDGITIRFPPIKKIGDYPIEVEIPGKTKELKVSIVSL